MTVSLSVMTQLKYDFVCRHDTQLQNPIVHCQVEYRVGRDIGQGVLQKTYKHVVGFFQEHLSETTTTIHMTVTNCVTYNQ